MTIVLTLICVGTVLLFLEVIMPGAILGIFAAICFAAAVWVSWVQMGVVSALVTAFVCAFLGLAAVFAWAYVLPRTSIGKRLLPKPDDVESADSPLKAHVGEECLAQTDMMPIGKVVLEGAVYDAQSVSGGVKKGEKLRVVDADFYELKVRPLSAASSEREEISKAPRKDGGTLERQVFESAHEMERPLPRIDSEK